MLKEKLKMMNGVLENGNYQLGQFKFGELRKSEFGRCKRILTRIISDVNEDSGEYEAGSNAWFCERSI